MEEGQIVLSLRKAFVAAALALSVAVPGGSVALADTQTCPDQAIFNVVLPAFLGLGSSATITTNESPTGRPGQCAGTFSVSAGGAVVAHGYLLANHSGSNVTAYFAGSTATGAFFFGSLTFNGTTGTATAYLITSSSCSKVTATFALVGGQFVPTAVTVAPCGND